MMSVDPQWEHFISFLDLSPPYFKSKMIKKSQNKMVFVPIIVKHRTPIISSMKTKDYGQSRWHQSPSFLYYIPISDLNSDLRISHKAINSLILKPDCLHDLS